MSEDAGTVIQINRVSKAFKGGVVALDDVTVPVRRGEFAAFIGPSGCGKSTLLRIVAGLIPATSGEVLIGGSPVTGPRSDVGMMFQKPTLLPWKSVLDNVLLPRTLRGDVDGAHEEALRLLEFLGLERFEHHFPRHLSGGMAQRAALARLLMIGADLMLLDEPFGALDEFTRERLNLELMRIHATAGLTTMLVTHNIGEAVLLADQVVVMSARPGRIAGVVPIPFERPRSIDLMRSEEFNAKVFEVRELLGEA